MTTGLTLSKVPRFWQWLEKGLNWSDGGMGGGHGGAEKNKHLVPRVFPADSVSVCPSQCQEGGSPEWSLVFCMNVMTDTTIIGFCIVYASPNTSAFNQWLEGAPLGFITMYDCIYPFRPPGLLIPHTALTLFTFLLIKSLIE